MLEQSFAGSSIAVCVKDQEKRVLLQNDLCRSICGNLQDEICEKGCMALHANDLTTQWGNRGCSVYRNSNIHGSPCDVALICSTDRIVTFLQPLDDVYDKALAHYLDFGLTRRETEVVGLVIRGKTNPEICQHLSISKATLRTHLNKLYGKLRDKGESVERFLPASRKTPRQR
jgi:DNA-binding CsgD family transcriptional regulator